MHKILIFTFTTGLFFSTLEGQLGPVAQITKIVQAAPIAPAVQELPRGTAETVVDKTAGPQTFPGITAFQKGQWVGSDNLWNIASSIGVSVEIIKPLGKPLPIASDAIKARVSSLFDKAGISPVADGRPPRAPLPFFHVLIMIYPIEKGYVASVSGRLFEAVTVPRYNADKSVTWQAITWEKQDFVISPGDLLVQQMDKTIDDITNSFIDRYKFFENIKFQTKNPQE